MSQADRAQYRKEAKDWYDTQIQTLDKRIEKPNMSSQLTEAQILSFNNIIRSNNRADGGRRATLQPGMGSSWTSQKMTAERAVQRAKWNEQIGNLKDSQRRGLSPARAQARLTRLQGRQNTGTTKYTSGKGKYGIKETVNGGVIDQRYRPESGKTQRTTQKEIDARAAGTRAADARSRERFRQDSLRQRARDIQRQNSMRDYTNRQRIKDATPPSTSKGIQEARQRAVDAKAYELDSERSRRNMDRHFGRRGDANRPIGSDITSGFSANANRLAPNASYRKASATPFINHWQTRRPTPGWVAKGQISNNSKCRLVSVAGFSGLVGSGVAFIYPVYQLILL